MAMDDKAIGAVFRVLGEIKFKADITPNKSTDERRLQKEAFRRIKEEKSRNGIIESSRRRPVDFNLLEGKRVRLFKEDIEKLQVKFNDDQLGNILGTLKESEVITDFQFQEDILKGDRFEIVLPEKFDECYQNYVLKFSPDYEDLKRLQAQMDEIAKNPEKVEKERQERKERKRQEIETIYSDIDFTQRAAKKGWEKKWDVLQTLYTFYMSGGGQISMRLPIASLAIKGRVESEIEHILDGLINELCFSEWTREGSDYKIWLIKKDRFEETYRRTEAIYKKFVKTEERKAASAKMDSFRKFPPAELKPEISVGNLVAYNDGSIRFKSEILKLRGQLKDLCRLFMTKRDRLVTIDEIRNEIIAADKREKTSFTTIAKYVSALRNSLKIHFGKDVIINQKEEGWFFRP